MECCICHNGPGPSAALFLLTSGDLTCSEHFPSGQMPVYDFAQDPSAQFFVNLLYTVTLFSQSNSPEIGKLMMPIAESITKASAEYIETLKKQYCVQASSWTCTNCNYQNAITNPICWQCRALPGTVASQPFQGTTPPVLVDEVNVSPDAWKCPREGCGALHWKTERACQCGYQNLDLVESRFEDEEEKSVPRANPATVVPMPIQMQNSLWACPCGYEYNRDYEEICTKCKKYKPGKVKEEEKAKEEEVKTWKCPQCGNYRPLDAKNCSCGYRSSEEKKMWLCRRENPKEKFCLVCFNMGCTVHE